MTDFNVQDELTVLQNQTKMIRKRSYSARKSQLDKYKFELLELKKAASMGGHLTVKLFMRTKEIKLNRFTLKLLTQRNVSNIISH